MTTKPARRSAFGARESQGAGEHPLNPTHKPERSPLAAAPLVAFGTRVPRDLLKELKLAALQRDMTVQEAVEAALRGWLAR